MEYCYGCDAPAVHKVTVHTEHGSGYVECCCACAQCEEGGQPEVLKGNTDCVSGLH